MGGQTYGQTDGWMEFLPILQHFVPCWGRCPESRNVQRELNCVDNSFTFKYTFVSLKNNFIRVDIITLVFFLTGAIRIKILYFLQLFASQKDLKYLLERLCQNLYLLLHGKKAPAGSCAFSSLA